MATAKKPTRSKTAKTKAKEAVEAPVVVEEPEKAEADIAAQAVEATPRKSGFMPLLIGGVLSGAIGFGAATYYFMSQPSEEAQTLVKVQAVLNDQGAKLETATASITAMQNGLESKAAAQETVDAFAQSSQRDDALAKTLNDLSGVFADFEARLTALEKRPIAEAGGLTGEAAAAYERELRTMRDLLETQRRDLEKLAADATARIEGVAQQAQTAEQAAEETAKATAIKAAVSQLQSALDNGGAFEATLAGLSGAGVTIPAVLTEAAKGGVPTLATLQEDFPQAARASLAASIKATSSDGAMGTIGSFFRSQVGARSLEPREGDDPDAVLSRAEAAIGAGDISGAIALIEALPKEGQAEMSEWVGSADVRQKAVDAVRALADGLNGN